MPYKDPKKRREFNNKLEIKERARKRTARWRKNHPNYAKHQRELYKKARTSRRATAKKYYKENQEKILEQQQKQNTRLRNIVLKGYSKNVPKCACCGVKGKEFLAIDHINGRKQMDTEPELKKIGYSSKLDGSKLYIWLKNNNFPKGFQVLCHNCNFAKGKLGQCPHQN